MPSYWWFLLDFYPVDLCILNHDNIGKSSESYKSATISFFLTDGHSESITFLYQLVKGCAGRSYGLNVARLADIPADVVKAAAQKSHDLEHFIMKRRLV